MLNFILGSIAGGLGMLVLISILATASRGSREEELRETYWSGFAAGQAASRPEEVA